MRLIMNFHILFKLLLLVVSAALVTLSSARAESAYKDYPTWIVDAQKNYSTPSNLPGDVENRVMFDEDIWWALDRANTDTIINRLAKAGFNVYVPCVWHGAGTYYSSFVAYQDPRILARIKNGDDPLEYLIKRAHQKNIEIHAWFTVVRRDDDKYKKFYDEYSPKDAFDVHNTLFREFIISLMFELVKNYNIDGLNLDYIRSMGYCTSKKCAAEYKEQTSRNLAADLILEKIPKSRIKSIEEWNERPVEYIVKSISDKSKKIKPNLMISVDSMPGARHLRMQGHDSQKWLNNKWIDNIFYMEYQNDFKISDINLAKSKVEQPDAIIPLFSLYDMEHPTLEKKPGALLRKSILAARKVWPNSGLAFYHYKQMSTEQVNELKSTVYAKPARPTWRKCESEECISAQADESQSSLQAKPKPPTLRQ